METKNSRNYKRTIKDVVPEFIIKIKVVVMKKIIYTICFFISGIAMGMIIKRTYMKKSIIKALLLSNNNYTSFRVMNQWVSVRQEGRQLSEYFERKGYRRIAIYGMGDIGEALLSELDKTKTKVLYGIDQNADAVFSNIDIVSLKDKLQKVDAVVVTVIHSFEAISAEIQKKLDCPVISIVDVVYDI